MSELSSEQFLALVQSCLEKSGSFEFSPHGGSMLPTVREGDSVKLVPPGDIRKYDVILYRRPGGKAVLHRVIACKGEKLVTRGDAQWLPEFNVRKESVVALAPSFTRDGKTVPLGGSPAIVMRNAYNGVRRFFHRAVNKIKRTVS